MTMVAFHSLSCTTTTVIVSGVTYYQCGPTWYQRAYAGGSTTYVVINAPSGY
jgi:cysteinyl-tRNA synthetase